MQERKKEDKKAAALRYSEDDDVPVITASGTGALAEKIEKIAMENSIPVIRDAIMANILNKEKSGQIPEKLFPAVAEILSYCYRIDKKFSEKIDKRTRKGHR